MDQTVRKLCMKKVPKEISMKTTEISESEGRPRVMEKEDNEMKQVTSSNNELQISCEN